MKNREIVKILKNIKLTLPTVKGICSLFCCYGLSMTDIYNLEQSIKKVFLDNIESFDKECLSCSVKLLQQSNSLKELSSDVYFFDLIRGYDLRIKLLDLMIEKYENKNGKI